MIITIERFRTFFGTRRKRFITAVQQEASYSHCNGVKVDIRLKIVLLDLLRVRSFVIIN